MKRAASEYSKHAILSAHTLRRHILKRHVIDPAIMSCSIDLQKPMLRPNQTPSVAEVKDNKDNRANDYRCSARHCRDDCTLSDLEASFLRALMSATQRGVSGLQLNRKTKLFLTATQIRQHTNYIDSVHVNEQSIKTCNPKQPRPKHTIQLLQQPATLVGTLRRLLPHNRQVYITSSPLGVSIFIKRTQRRPSDTSV